ncbi:DUF1569 domain-containing protein [Spongiimicrobium sp. 3-5]|uniref:DUF1569 domain-containing protein n=1 Tax=Spongiimicrobium sp. 3-5 TaxID=3332596 RepID=UPI00397E96A6
MKSIFEKTCYQEVLERIDMLTENSQANWGKMGVAQMCCHCKYPLELALGKKSLKKPNPIMKLLMKGFKASMYNDKIWKPNLPTPAQFKVETEKDFNEEITQLRMLINSFHDLRERKSWDPHPAFGNFTHEQWGQMQYKHLDHHLRQFGV